MGNWLGVEKGQAPLVCPVRACQLGSHSLILPFAPSTMELSRCRNTSLKIQNEKTPSWSAPKRPILGMLDMSSLAFDLSPIPAKQDGFWYRHKKGKEETVLIEAFFDPVCPDSRDSWPLSREQSSNMALVFRLSCIPSLCRKFLNRCFLVFVCLVAFLSLFIGGSRVKYHDNAFATSRALHIINKVNSSVTYHLLEAFFDYQENFYGKATFNLTRAAVLDQIAKFVTKTLGKSYRAAIKSGFTDSKTDRATRVSFKLGCLRGVYGTPFFFVNGFPLPDAGSALDVKGWKKVLDPLVSGKGKSVEEFRHVY
ncbi:UNVERIFIED_CONTAM: hypothetical protein Sradi_3734900 [Sesamum radiatum]|uniref:Thioredoxin-like fold domain-containing protein n=1 Tax=Sesamum radiatum TaxID=300843 RepID=A0AAW2PY66_SESRA